MPERYLDAYVAFALPLIRDAARLPLAEAQHGLSATHAARLCVLWGLDECQQRAMLRDICDATLPASQR